MTEKLMDIERRAAVFLAPHHIAPELDRRDQVGPRGRAQRVRWTWIAGNRYGGIRWL